MTKSILVLLYLKTKNEINKNVQYTIYIMFNIKKKEKLNL